MRHISVFVFWLCPSALGFTFEAKWDVLRILSPREHAMLRNAPWVLGKPHTWINSCGDRDGKQPTQPPHRWSQSDFLAIESVSLWRRYCLPPRRTGRLNRNHVDTRIANALTKALLPLTAGDSKAQMPFFCCREHQYEKLVASGSSREACSQTLYEVVLRMRGYRPVPRGSIDFAGLRFAQTCLCDTESCTSVHVSVLWNGNTSCNIACPIRRPTTPATTPYASTYTPRVLELIKEHS